MTTIALALVLLQSAQSSTPLDLAFRSSEPPSSAELTSGGLLWSFPCPDLPLLALGDRGGQLLSASSDSRLRLFSCFDSNPPTPVWSMPRATHWSLAAASDTDIYLHGLFRKDHGFYTAVELRRFRSRSNVPEWRFGFPEQAASKPLFDLSRDGDTIVSLYVNHTAGAIEIRVHDPLTGQAIQTYIHPQFHYVVSLDLSPDGSVLAFSYTDDPLGVEVYETATGAHLASLPGMIVGDQALSNVGGMLATYNGPSSFDSWVRVYARDASDYQPVLDVPMPVGVFARGLAVSEDGTTLAACWSDQFQPNHGIVRAYELSTGTMTMEHVDAGTTQDITPTSVSIAADGSRFVVGQGGSGSGAFPELAVYSPASSTPLRTHSEGGGVYAVALSPDGKRYAAARTPGNLNSDEGILELYEFGREDFGVRGRPSVGETITFELYGAPGSRAALLRSFALAPTPIDVQGVGTLHLDPGTLSSSSMGVVPASGVASHSTLASTVPGMIGRTLWFQGLTTNPRTLTNDFVQLTIVP